MVRPVQHLRNHLAETAPLTHVAFCDAAMQSNIAVTGLRNVIDFAIVSVAAAITLPDSQEACNPSRFPFLKSVIDN